MNARQPKLGAVVMAAGLGTRMRSDVPKHLHPLLGRRMVDWVLASARGWGGSDRRGRLARDGGRLQRARGRRAGGSARDGRRRSQARAARSSRTGENGSLSGDTPLLTTGLLGELVETHDREGRGRPCFPSSPTTRSSTGACFEMPMVGSPPSSTSGRICQGAEPCARSNSSIYVFRADRLWLVLDRLLPHNVQGELYLTDRSRPRPGRRTSRCTRRDPVETEGVNTRAELAAAAAALRDRINQEHMRAGATIVDPETTWIDAESVLGARCGNPPVHGHSWRLARSGGRGGRPSRSARRGDRRRACQRRPVLLPSPWHGARGGGQGGHVRRDQELSHRRADQVLISYLGDADVGADTNIAAGNITANQEHTRVKQRTAIGRNVRTGVDNTFVAPVSIGDHAWIGAGSVITEMSHQGHWRSRAQSR